MTTMHTYSHTQTPPALPLAGKTALVTGASRGIGRAVARCLAAAGARLLLVARDRKLLAIAHQELAANGAQAEVLPCDIASVEELSSLAARIESAGGCDILVNAAGIGKMGAPLHEISLEDFDATLATNLVSCVSRA